MEKKESAPELEIIVDEDQDGLDTLVRSAHENNANRYSRKNLTTYAEKAKDVSKPTANETQPRNEPNPGIQQILPEQKIILKMSKLKLTIVISSATMENAILRRKITENANSAAKKPLIVHLMGIVTGENVCFPIPNLKHPLLTTIGILTLHHRHLFLGPRQSHGQPTL